MKLLRTLRNYYFYCGIEKEEYNALKKAAYISNFEVWKILHIVMTTVFALLYAASFFSSTMGINQFYYLCGLIYSAVACWLFFVLEKDSLVGQLLIYLSISLLFLFAGFISLEKPDRNATTFIAFLLTTPMFMIDKPFFMTIELVAASTIYMLWMKGHKIPEVWRYDLINVVTFTVIGAFLNIIANSIRIKEFVLTKKINIQKDIDELTGLKNKGALTREINEFLADNTTRKGIMLLLDADRFKAINDTYGHDVGDRVIIQIGTYLNEKFTGTDVAGRFGGDEFVVFIKNTDDRDTARRIASEIVKDIPEIVKLPDKDRKVNLSIGISFYHGDEKNYSAIFKKADVALYKAKADPENRFCFHE